jgi:thioesterase domain-containing protein
MKVDTFVNTSGQFQDRRDSGKRETRPEKTEGWVVAFHPGGALPPLFCACSAGGDASDYRDLAQALPADQPVYAFGVPPPEAGNAFPTVRQLAATYVGEVRRRQPHGPYRLCGHSFGGLVVYEMAVLLTGDGEEVSLVALIDTLNPAFRRNMPAWERVRFQLTYIVDRITKYVRNLVSGRVDKIARDSFEFVYRRCERAMWKLTRLVFGGLRRPAPSLIHSDEMVLVAAWHRYDPGNYAGRLTLLNSADRPHEYGRDGTLGWGKCASGPIDIQAVPGDHLSIMHPPFVRSLAERIERHLARP